jgi:hypothetical protein
VWGLLSVKDATQVPYRHQALERGFWLLGRFRGMKFHAMERSKMRSE